MTTTTYETLSASDHTINLRKAVIASTIGTTIEWYDFFIYGTAAGLVFGKLYFPNEDPLTATLAAFATYFVGFVGRPIGAAISVTTAIASAARRLSSPRSSAWASRPFSSPLSRPIHRSAFGAQ